jgi:hypothetical protein
MLTIPRNAMALRSNGLDPLRLLRKRHSYNVRVVRKAAIFRRRRAVEQDVLLLEAPTLFTRCDRVVVVQLVALP